MVSGTVHGWARQPSVSTSGHTGSFGAWGPADEMGYILVVDDDETIREVIDLTLAEEGYDVVCARSGEHALRLLRERAPGLVLFDLVMPDQRGEEFIGACRREPNGAAPMIVVSGMPDLDRVVAEIGADGSVSKPFDLTDLLATVQTALGAREVA